MYKCRNCNHTFSEGEQKTHYERHNDYYTEPISICPVCGSCDYEEMVCCKICGEGFLKDELYGKMVCKECIEDYLGHDEYEQAETALRLYQLEQKGDD